MSAITDNKAPIFEFIILRTNLGLKGKENKPVCVWNKWTIYSPDSRNI